MSGVASGSRDRVGLVARLAAAVDRVIVDVGVSGVVRVDVRGLAPVERASGLAHRALGIANSVETQFATASGTKGLTALTVLSLVEEGVLDLDTTARSLLADDLPLVDDRVTVEQLLAHRSGIGDYLDEDEIDDATDHVLGVPVHELATTEQYLTVLDGHPMVSEPGERFSYCNGGYVVLALLAERAAGLPFHELVQRHVCGPAGMADTAFLRSDELPGRAAVGYLHDEGLRSNVLHLPVGGSGDGGIYTTAADVQRLWEALFAGRIVPPAVVDEMVRPRSDAPDGMRYALGFWLDGASDAVVLVGSDAGVGFVSSHDPTRDVTITVICNQTRGAWPAGQQLREAVADVLVDDEQRGASRDTRTPEA